MALRTSMLLASGSQSSPNADIVVSTVFAALALLLVAVWIAYLAQRSTKSGPGLSLPVSRNDVDVDIQLQQQQQQQQQQQELPSANTKKKKAQQQWQRKAAARKAATPSSAEKHSVGNINTEIAELVPPSMPNRPLVDVGGTSSTTSGGFEIDAQDWSVSECSQVCQRILSALKSDEGDCPVDDSCHTKNADTSQGSNFNRSLLLAHREISIRVAHGPPGLELPEWKKQWIRSDCLRVAEASALEVCT